MPKFKNNWFLSRRCKSIVKTWTWPLLYCKMQVKFKYLVHTLPPPHTYTCTHIHTYTHLIQSLLADSNISIVQIGKLDIRKFCGLPKTHTEYMRELSTLHCVPLSSPKVYSFTFMLLCGPLLYFMFRICILFKKLFLAKQSLLWYNGEPLRVWGWQTKLWRQKGR